MKTRQQKPILQPRATSSGTWFAYCLHPPSLTFSFTLSYVIPSNTPLSSLSFFPPCCLPLHALSHSLCSSPQPSICLPPALPQLLFGELFISLYVINQHLFKRYDWGAVEVEDRRRDIDRWWRTRWGGNWGATNGGEGKKQKQSTREHDNWDQETGRKKCWKGGGGVKEWGKREIKTAVMRGGKKM